VALGVLALLHWGRVRQLTTRERLLAESRLHERERIARELHDTLLQGTQALIVNVHRASKLSRSGERVHEALDEALARADSVVAEGRDRIQDLRVQVDANADLATSLAAVGEELSKDGDGKFRAVVEGRVRAVAPNVVREACRIGREAMLNAFRHAQADSIEVQIVYSEEDFRLLVRDDGLGIDEKTLEGGSLPGHWGLPGMRERAQGIGATLEVRSHVGAGTEIELRIPASVAYRRRLARSRWWSFGRSAKDTTE
jgi:signal transduction histidine kinase